MDLGTIEGRLVESLERFSRAEGTKCDEQAA
jgi:hypothetical protein